MAENNYAECEQVIYSVSTFLKYIEDQKRDATSTGNDADFLFRGQPVDKPLIPKLARLRWNGSPQKCENLILEEFARTSTPFVNPGHDDRWDRLAIAQHHGLPTRLLDWTYSATAALWFAVRRNSEMDEHGRPLDGVVWIMKPIVDDFINFPTQEAPLEMKRTRIFRPRITSQRISAQSGLFTIHVMQQPDDACTFVPLERHSRFSKKLVKIPIAARYFRKLRKQLDTCGVNASTMFPDLVGSCEHLTWRYTKS